MVIGDRSEGQARSRGRGGRGGGVVGLLFVLWLLAALWFGGFLHFAADLPRRAADDRTTEAIVVLTGGANRLDEGLDLLIRDRARLLLISGVDRDTTAAHLQARSGTAPEKFACCVAVGYEAQDTEGNAVETALWVRENGLSSLRLVTAGYHMPRSLLLFHAAMPDVEIVPHPVFPDHVKLDEWWRWPGTARLLLVEYGKYLWSLLSVRLAGL